jgi:hypothetical protein
MNKLIRKFICYIADIAVYEVLYERKEDSIIILCSDTTSGVDG